MTNQTSLLTEEDFKTIKREGIPFPPPLDLAHVGKSRKSKAVLTVRGIQFYTAALTYYGIPVELHKVQNRNDLYLLTDACFLAMKGQSRAALEQAYRQGAVPLQSKESIWHWLYGSLTSWSAAAKKERDCRSAGENVVPVKFK